MQLITIFAVFVFLIRRICLSETAIMSSKWDGFAELEAASTKMLTTCYGNRHNTLLVFGEFPDSYIKKLSINKIFSLIVMSDKRRKKYAANGSPDIYHSRKRKIPIVVTIANERQTSYEMMKKYGESLYHNTMASILILGWSPIVKSIGCGKGFNNALTLGDYNYNQMLNVNFMCHNVNRRLVLHTSTPFANKAPKPWIYFHFYRKLDGPIFYHFIREFREDEEICENLDFDKTHDLAGFPIQVIYNNYGDRKVINNTSIEFSSVRRERIEQRKRFSFINNFLERVNATPKNLWIKSVIGDHSRDMKSIHSRPAILRGVDSRRISKTYPNGLVCKFLITQFRGNKTQLQKIYSVIDSYSWIGMYIVYLITLIFFKFFLHRPLMVGILNLCRLTCNSGLPKLPANGSPQIYLACLLFFVVTMQGIFVGNLASLLTHDFPARQVNSIQDLADLGYTVLADKSDFIHFDNSLFDGRLVKRLLHDNCAQQVSQNFSRACLTWGAEEKTNALNKNLHVSPGCITSEYIVTTIPWRWALEEKINNFLGIMMSANIMMPLDAMVDEKRFLEAESAEILLEPEIMTFNDLAFAFAILGIGLGCASIIFIIEIMIEQYNRRVTKTRVIVLN